MNIRKTQQKGVALVIALVLLLLVTLLGLAGVQNVTLEEKMAGATQDRQVTFQVAEAELRSLEGSAATRTFPASGCANGLCATACGMTSNKALCAFASDETDCTSVCYRDNTFTFWSSPTAASSNAAFCRCYLIEKIDSNYRITVAVWRNPSNGSCADANCATQSSSLVVLQSLTQ